MVSTGQCRFCRTSVHVSGEMFWEKAWEKIKCTGQWITIYGRRGAEKKIWVYIQLSHSATPLAVLSLLWFHIILWHHKCEMTEVSWLWDTKEHPIRCWLLPVSLWPHQSSHWLPSFGSVIPMEMILSIFSFLAVKRYLPHVQNLAWMLVSFAVWWCLYLHLTWTLGDHCTWSQGQ